MEFIILGTLGFWMFAAFVTLVLMALIANERPGFATLFFIAALFATNYLTTVKVFDWMAEHPLGTCLLAAGYFVAGALWAIGKWAFFVFSKRREYNRMKKDFLLGKGLEDAEEVPKKLRGAWRNHIGYNSLRFPPDPKHNKSRIMTWMVFWPWSLVWTIIDDPVKRLFEFIFRRLRNFLSAISKRAFRGTENDFLVPDEPVVEEPAEEDPEETARPGRCNAK